MGVIIICDKVKLLENHVIFSKFRKIMLFIENFIIFQKNNVIFSIFRKNHMIFKKLNFITKHYHTHLLFEKNLLNLKIWTRFETRSRFVKIRSYYTSRPKSRLSKILKVLSQVLTRQEILSKRLVLTNNLFVTND